MWKTRKSVNNSEKFISLVVPKDILPCGSYGFSPENEDDPVFCGEKNGFFQKLPRFPDGDDVMMFYVKSERLKTGNLHNEFSLMMSEAAR